MIVVERYGLRRLGIELRARGNRSQMTDNEKTTAPRTDDHEAPATEPADAERAAAVAAGSGRDDDRNEQVPGSPAPDPTEAESDAEDVPQAD